MGSGGSSHWLWFQPGKRAVVWTHDCSLLAVHIQEKKKCLIQSLRFPFSAVSYEYVSYDVYSPKWNETESIVCGGLGSNMDLLVGAKICERACSQTVQWYIRTEPTIVLSPSLHSHTALGLWDAECIAIAERGLICLPFHSCGSKSEASLKRGRAFSTLLSLPALLNASSSRCLLSPHTGSILSQIPDQFWAMAGST